MSVIKNWKSRPTQTRTFHRVSSTSEKLSQISPAAREENFPFSLAHERFCSRWSQSRKNGTEQFSICVAQQHKALSGENNKNILSSKRGECRIRSFIKASRIPMSGYNLQEKEICWMKKRQSKLVLRTLVPLLIERFNRSDFLLQFEVLQLLFQSQNAAIRFPVGEI